LEDSTWQYCKRPIDITMNRVFVGKQYLFPPLAGFLVADDGLHTSRIPVEPKYRYKKVANSLISFVRQFHLQQLTEQDIESVHEYLRTVIMETGLLEYSKTSSGSSLIFPRSFRSVEVMRDLEAEYWNSIVTLPCELSSVTQTLLEFGEEYVGKMFKGLKIIEDMGYGTSQLVVSSFVVRDNPERFRSFFDSDPMQRPNFAYTFVLDSDCPIWMIEHVNSILVSSGPELGDVVPDIDYDLGVLETEV